MSCGCDFDDDEEYHYGNNYDCDYEDYDYCYDSDESSKGSCHCYGTPNSVYTYELVSQLDSQRRNGEFIDVVVQVEGRKFPCHRAVLATLPYFKSMLSSNFTESRSKVVHLQGIDSTSFSEVLDFLYSGEIVIGKGDVQGILQAAHMLQFKEILQYCWSFIENNLCMDNCVGIMRLADLYGNAYLEKRARTMAVSKFSQVTQDEVFFSLSVEELLNLLRDKDLKVTNEDDVVSPVIKWLDHAPESRQTAILKILPEIRLFCVRVSMLQKLESHPVIRESAECLAKITAAREKHLRGTRVEDASSFRRGISDNLAIIVGGWKAVKKSRPCHDEQANIVQPTPLQSIICIDPDSQHCYHITNLPTPVAGHMSVVSAGGHLYITGGCVQPLIGDGPHTAPSRQAFRYDFSSDTWLRLPDMPAGRAEHQSVVIDGKLYLVGGDTENSLVTMNCYDPKEGAWIDVDMLPTMHASSTSAVTDKENFLQMQSEYSHCYMDGQKGIVDTINSTYESGDHYPRRKTSLPFALFGHSFIETRKSRIGWYCRDLTVKLQTDMNLLLPSWLLR
ncbi:kelch repeat and BTB domain-containing protein 8-like isoform X1 [Branchiostoma floridae x Branchiostoma japonicum]